MQLKFLPLACSVLPTSATPVLIVNLYTRISRMYLVLDKSNYVLTNLMMFWKPLPLIAGRETLMRLCVSESTMHCHFFFFFWDSSLAGRHLKLRLLKGDAYTIPACVSLANGSKVTLKVFCTAAVVPGLSLKNDRKIPANRLCKYLHVSTPTIYL